MTINPTIIAAIIPLGFIVVAYAYVLGGCIKQLRKAVRHAR